MTGLFADKPVTCSAALWASAKQFQFNFCGTSSGHFDVQHKIRGCFSRAGTVPCRKSHKTHYCLLEITLLE